MVSMNRPTPKGDRMTTARIDRRSRAIDVAALRVAADLVENPPPADVESETPFPQLVFYTADEVAAQLGLDLFDDDTLTELTDRVQGILRHINS